MTQPRSSSPRLLIAEDEEIQRDQLRASLASIWPQAEIVAEAANGTDAWDMFLEHEPDAAFLDIRMPGASGFDVARRIRSRAPIVFVTAYGEHALEAFDAGAFDYVVKPIVAERLRVTVDRLQHRLTERPASPETLLARLDALEQRLGKVARPRLELLQATQGREIRLVHVDDVIYFDADNRYTRVVYRAGDSTAEVVIRTPLKELLGGLDPERFWQIHRSTIVAVREIAKVERDDERYQVVLRSRGERLPVSRPFHYLFKGR